MKQVIIIHGLVDENELRGDIYPSPSNTHWLPWVQKQLTRKDILCQTLEMPRAYDPIYHEHKSVLDQMSISPETILIGYSCGAGFLLRYFSEYNNLTPKKLILVAPWLDLEGYLKDINPRSEFFNFELDPSLEHRTNIICIYSTDDEDSTLTTISLLQSTYTTVDYRIFQNKGHFDEADLESKEFPELLGIIQE